MRKSIHLLLIFICSSILAFSQDNLIEVFKKHDQFYDSLYQINPSLVDSFGIKHYLRWKSRVYNSIPDDSSRMTVKSQMENSFDIVDSIYYINTSGSGGGTYYVTLNLWTELGYNTQPEYLHGGKRAEGTGRIHSIERDPNNDQVYYAGSPSGGLFKTIDRGENWSVLNTDYLSVPGLSHMQIDPSNSQRIFIATGDGDNGFSFSRGIYFSDNGGSTWIDINGSGATKLKTHGLNWSWCPNYVFIRKILYVEETNQLVAAATNGLWVSSEIDPTKTAQQIHDDIEWTKVVDKVFTDVILGPSNNRFTPGIGSYIIAGGQEIWHFTNSSGLNNPANWSLLPDFYNASKTNFSSISIVPERAYIMERMTLRISEDDRNKMYVIYFLYDARDCDGGGPAVQTGLQYTYDFSNPTNNWNEWKNNGTHHSMSGFFGWITGGRFQAFDVYPNDADKILTGNVYGIYRSSDGGNTIPTGVPLLQGKDHHDDIHWIKILPYSGPDRSPNPNPITEIWLGTDGGVFLSEDDGSTWISRNEGLGCVNTHGFAVTQSRDPEYLIGHYDHPLVYVKDNDVVQIGPLGDSFEVKMDNKSSTDWNYIYSSVQRTSFQIKKKPEELIFISPSQALATNSSWWSDVEMAEPDQSIVFIKKDFDIFRLENVDPHSVASIKNNITLVNDETFSETYYNPLHPNVLYVAMNLTKKIYRTENALETNPNLVFWTELTSVTGIPAVKYSDIVIDDENPLKIWLVRGNWAETTANRVQLYDPGSTPNLKNLNSDKLEHAAVGAIVHEYGSNDKIYIATSRGVFYMDNSSQFDPNSSTIDWIEIPGLPQTRVNDLEINYCTRELVAGTFGRGLWKTDLQNYKVSDEIINTNTTWSSSKVFMRNVVVQPGAKLTIKTISGKPQTNIFFGPENKLIIKPRGEVIINNAVLTSQCDEVWGGVEVWGKKTLPQTPISNQGYVKVINGGTIENAEIGIAATKHLGNGDVDWSKGGGVIYCYEAIFINNRKDIEFLPYHDLSIRPEPANLSVFYKATFTTNDFAYFKPNEEKGHVTMLNVNGVEFQGCKFKNERTEYEYSNEGIISYKSGYRVTDYCNSYSPNGCEEYTDRTLFKGLGCGVRSMDVANGTRYSAFVDHAIFDYNVHGVYLGAVDFPWITRNEFYTHGRDIEVVNEKPSAFPYAIYLDHCSSYEIQENDMWADWPVVGDVQNSFGIVVTNSALKNEMVYNNYIDGYKIGIEAIGANRIVKGIEGLQIKCNDFVDLKYDIYVGDHPGIPSVDVGIRTEQGNPPSNPSGPGPELAGNRFSHSNNDSLGIEFDDYLNGSPLINYHHHSGSNDDRVIPALMDNDDIINVVPIPEPNAFDDDPNNGSCPDYIETVSAGEDQAKALEMTNAAFQLAIKENTLSLLEDGGNTPLLESEVDQVTLNTSYQLYADLMLKSPNLSDEIIYELVGKETQFPKALLRDVLVANSQAMNDNGVLEAINGRWDQLPDYMMHQIMTAAEGGMTAKELLESEISYYSEKYQNALKRRVELRAKDTSGVYNSDSVLVLLEGETNPYFRLLAIEINMSQGDYSAAENLKSTFLSTANIEERDYPIFEELMSFYNDFSFIGKEDSLFYIIDQNEIDNLWNYSTQGISRASIISGSHLERIDENFIYVEPTILPNQTQNRAIYMEVAETTSYLKVYPNPTTNHVFVSYRSDYVVGNRTLVLMDVNGKIIMNRELFNTEDEIVIPLKNYASGVYFVTLRIEGEVELSEKLIIE